MSIMDRPLNRVLGKATARKCHKLGLETPRDLLYHFPRRYDKWGQLTPMSRLNEGDDITVMAKVADSQMRRTRGGKWQLSVTITDGTMYMDVVFWAKHSGMLRGHQSRLKIGETFYFAGKVGMYRHRLQLTYPDYDAADNDRSIDIHQPIAIYSTTKGLSSWVLAKAIDTVLLPLTEGDIDDPLPQSVREAEDLPGIIDAFHMIHHPTTDDDYRRAYRRFQYEEALVLQVLLAQQRYRAQQHRAPQLPTVTGGLTDSVIEHLPFELTDGQRDACQAIGRRLTQTVPANVLLQGDVGAGKTVVALLMMTRALDNNYQAAMLAPTSVLATQHYQSLSRYLGTVGAPVELLTAATPADKRRELAQRVQRGEPLIIVGTHALLSDTVSIPKLAVVIIDEQHRFGVGQRDVLRHKGSATPHVVVMTATPIPRTVAMTVFGDMDTVVLKQLPAGRHDIATFIVPWHNRVWVERMWQRAREEIDAGGRVFIVCPRVEATTDPQARDVMSIEQMTTLLPTIAPLADIGWTVVTGAMKDDDKQAAMASFDSGKTPLLVATTVVEVGVDIVDATMMIIMDADFFGLSQLHQLRGRVGRGDKPALCMAVTTADTDSLAWERLQAFADSQDGFVLAEKDLQLRKEGNILGAQQSGTTSELRTLALTDKDTVTIIGRARTYAWDIVSNDPTLADHPALNDATARIDTEQEAYLERG